MLKKLLTTSAILAMLATTAQAQSKGPAPEWVMRKAYATFTPDTSKPTYEQIKQREAWLREQGYASIVVDDTLQFWNKQQAVRIPADANGHFYPKVTIKGTPIRLVYDTGATDVSLSAEDARKPVRILSPCNSHIRPDREWSGATRTDNTVGDYYRRNCSA